MYPVARQSSHMAFILSIEHSQMIKTYKDANVYLEELHIFFKKEGHIEKALKIGSIMDKVSLLSSKKQTTLDSWLIH